MSAFLRKLFEKYARQLIVSGGEGITKIPNKDRVRAMANSIYKDFREAGVRDNMIKSEADINFLHSKVNELYEANLVRNLKDALKPKKSADVLDLTGKKIDTSKPILGDKNVPETEEQILQRLNKQNKESVERLKYERLKKKREKEIMDDMKEFEDPEDLAHGGRTGSGLNYLLGEDDQNSRVPYGEGSTTQDDFNQYLKDRNQRDKDEQRKKFKKDFEDWKKWKETEGGTVNWAAEGGRIGYAAGGMGRRAFLKLMAALGATGVAAKSGLATLLKGGGKKAVIKDLTSVPIKDISGMPAWFKPLVNKVIKEGDDVTKKFAEADRQIVHKTKLPDSQTDVIVTQDLNTGDVLVDIGMGKHGFADGLHGQPVRLEYKAAEDIMSGPDMDDMHKVGVREPHIKVKSRDEMTFDQKKHPDKTPEEFWVEEAEFTGGHPENVKFEETVSEKFGSHGSNFDEVEKFATGKVKKTKTTESRFLGKKYLSEGDDMASGGRVPLGVGGIAGMLGE